MVILGGWAFSYERGTPVNPDHHPLIPNPKNSGTRTYRRNPLAMHLLNPEPQTLNPNQHPLIPNPKKIVFFIDNLLVQIHLIIEMIWWTVLAPWEFEFRFPGSLTSPFLPWFPLDI